VTRPLPGVGDRWLAGVPVEGVAFAPRERVEFARGSMAGRRATVLLLVAVSPEPMYHVITEEGDPPRELHVRQSALRSVGG
jgi:hypothetical protein